MLERYVIDVFEGLPRSLEGYNYLATEVVYVPFLKTDLSITKRTTQGISIIEEYLLKFINAGLEHIDDLCGILGLDIEFVNISIADLYRKDYITHSSKICRMTDKGRGVLENLNETKNETDILRGICLNLVTGDIEKETNNLIRDCPLHKYKLETHIEMNEYLKVIKGALPYLKQVFQEGIVEIGKSDQELVNVVNLSYDRIWFLPVKINVYVSHDNQSMDLLALSSLDRRLLDKIKNIIVDDIIKGKVLTDHIKKGHSKSATNVTAISSIETSETLLTLLRKSVQNRDDFLDASNSLENAIFSQRKLFYNEIIPLLRLYKNKLVTVTLNISGDLKRKANTPEVISIIQELCDYNLTINYAYSRDIQSDIRLLRNSIPSVEKVKFNCDTKIVTEFTLLLNDDYVICRIENECNICNGMTALQEAYYLLCADYQNLQNYI